MRIEIEYFPGKKKLSERISAYTEHFELNNQLCININSNKMKYVSNLKKWSFSAEWLTSEKSEYKAL